MTDYNKVLRSFIKFQKEAGWHLVSATDGEDRIDNPTVAKAVEWATATDICRAPAGALQISHG